MNVMNEETKIELSELQSGEDPRFPRAEVSGDKEDLFLIAHEVIMTLKATTGDKWLRRSIFCTTCTIGKALF